MCMYTQWTAIGVHGQVLAFVGLLDVAEDSRRGLAPAPILRQPMEGSHVLDNTLNELHVTMIMTAQVSTCDNTNFTFVTYNRPLNN